MPATPETQAPAETSAETPAEASGFADLAPEALAIKVEAALLAADRPWSAGRLADAMGLGGAQAVEQAVEHLNAEYERTGRSMRIEPVAGGLRVLTLAEHGDAVEAVQKRSGDARLSVAAMEALSIVAYRQPIQRTDIEAIRGAASGEVLRALMDRRLVKVVGRAEEIGRPMLYGTTQHFLEAFGLTAVRDLPKVEAMPTPSAPAPAKTAEGETNEASAETPAGSTAAQESSPQDEAAPNPDMPESDSAGP
ncbi:MAG: SMC-Scp complex subunit ScpB [Planctomycetota bacterium]